MARHLDAFEGRVGDDGKLDVKNVPTGVGIELDLVFSGCTYHSAATAALEPGETRDLGIIRLQLAATLRGTIRTAAGAPIEGVQVWLDTHTRYPPEFKTPRTDSAGRFVMQSLYPGSCHLLAAGNGFLLGKTKEIALEGGKTTSVELILEEGKRYAGCQ